MEAFDSADDPRTIDDDLAPIARSPQQPFLERSAELTSSTREIGDRYPVRAYRSRISEVADFIMSLEYRLAQIEGGKGTLLERAREVQGVLRQLLMREVGVPSLEDGAPQFFRRLCEGGPIVEHFTRLYREARAVQSGSDASEIFQSPRRLSQELETVLNWYLRRKTSLFELQNDSYTDELRERIFNVRIFHDRSWAGLSGCEVSVGLWLVGRADQRLWLKVFARAEGVYVATRPRWQHWTDDTDSFAIGGRGQAPSRFSSLVPVTPRAQRQVIDSATVFVPYEALQLPRGTREVDFEILLCDERGHVVLDASQVELLSIPANPVTTSSKLRSDSSHEDDHDCEVPSMQALGIWPIDYGSTSQIISVDATSGLRETGSTTQEVLNVEVGCDVCGAANQRLHIEFRVLRRDGSLVGSQVRALGSAQGDFLMRMELFPRRPVVRMYSLQTQIPLRTLALEPGAHSLYLEVALLSPDDRALCGVLHPFNCDISSSGTPLLEDQSAAQHPIKDLASGIEISGLHVTNGFNPLVDGTASVRAQLDLTHSHWANEMVRVVCSLETTEGVPLRRPTDRELLRRTVCVGGGLNEEKVRSAVLHFEERELIPAWADVVVANTDKQLDARRPDEFIPIQDSKPAPRLLLRAQVYSMRDQLIGELTRTSLPSLSAIGNPNGLALRPPINPGAEANGQLELKRLDKEIRPARPTLPVDVPYIADVHVAPQVLTRMLDCTIRINVPVPNTRARKGTLYVELIDATGAAVLQRSEGPRLEGLLGLMRTVEFTPLLESFASVTGTVQVAVQIPVDSSNLGRTPVKISADRTPSAESQRGPAVKIMFFASDGRLVQVVRRILEPQLLQTLADEDSLVKRSLIQTGHVSDSESAGRATLGEKFTRFFFG